MQRGQIFELKTTGPDGAAPVGLCRRKSSTDPNPLRAIQLDMPSSSEATR